jgi:acylaminoacyl-peptidase
VRLYRAKPGEAPAAVSPDRAMTEGFSVAGGVIAMAVTSPADPASLWVHDGKESRRLTRHNEDWLKSVWLAPQEEVTYASGEFEIQGWFQPAFGKTEKVPMILEIHGGPAWYYGWRWFFEMQLISSRGFAVFTTNPRGSTGYGTKFHRANEKDWGGGDFRDLMAGVDHILKAHCEIDPERLGVTGGSYGGYMTNWTIGHTDRFKAAVTDRCVSNLNSFVTSDINLWIAEVYFDTTPWDKPDLLHRHSPMAFVKEMKTPLLIIHSENDFRTPIGQAEELFLALKKLDRAPVEFVRYPDEDHDLSRAGTPSRQADRLQRTIGWFEKHLK